MTFLPIAERELRVAARAARTYWSRALAALVVIVIAIFIFDSYARFGRSKVGGQQVFATLAYLAFAYSLFAGAALTADCLSSEKREETLGFLFLTDLKGYDVVLGKLLATSLRSVYGLLATFPIMSLSLLLGGVRAGEFWRVILVLMDTLLLSLSMGLLISTLYRRQRVTTHLASLVMLLLAVVPVGVSYVAKSAGGVPTLWLDPALISPVYCLQTAFESGYVVARMVGPSFWTALMVQLAFGILLLIRASWLLPHSWQEGALPRGIKPSQRPGSIPNRLGHRRRPVLDQNPFYWLARRGRGITLGLSAVLLAVAGWAFAARMDRDEFAAVRGAGILLVALVSRLLIAFCAAQRFAEDKETGALDLILTTPIGVSELIAGQWQAIAKKLAWPVVGSLALYLFLVLGGQGIEGWSDQEVRVAWFTMSCVFLLTFADAIALGWLGMWAGLGYRQVPHAAAVCLAKVVLPPALIPAAFIWNHGLSSADEYVRTNPYWIPGLWLVLGLATDLAWSLWARHKLFHDFRTAATDHFQTRPGRLSISAQIRAIRGLYRRIEDY